MAWPKSRDSIYLSKKKDKDRRLGKGRRCNLGDGIDSIPCRTSHFPQGWFEIKVEENNRYVTKWILWK